VIPQPRPREAGEGDPLPHQPRCLDHTPISAWLASVPTVPDYFLSGTLGGRHFGLHFARCWATRRRNTWQPWAGHGSRNTPPGNGSGRRLSTNARSWPGHLPGALKIERAPTPVGGAKPPTWLGESVSSTPQAGEKTRMKCT